MNFKYISGKLHPIKDVCNKLTIEGKVCGKRIGTCIHDWRPTPFGEQTSKDKDTVA